jgi:hypothetical protein
MRSKEEIAEYQKEYNKVNKVKIAARKKAYYEENREKCIKSGKTFYEAHKISLRATQKVYRNTEKGKLAKKRSTLKFHYGLPLEKYQSMYDFQKGRCKICGVFKKVLHVDHNHITNKVRALLCGLCNTALGGFKDNSLFLKKAIVYLKNYESREQV